MLPSAKLRFLGGRPLGRNQDPKGGEAEAERRRAAGRMKSPEACDWTSKGEARETSASWIASPKVSSDAMPPPCREIALLPLAQGEGERIGQTIVRALPLAGRMRKS